MKVNINYINGEYHWELYDGPDEIYHYTGIASSLGEAFEQIIKKQIVCSLEH